jgi:hypothetical protein
VTGDWLTVTDAAVLLRRTEREVRQLIIAEALYAELDTFDYRVSRASAEEYARRLTPRDPDNPAERQMTTSDDIDYFREQNT